MIACNSCGAINETVKSCSHCPTDVCDRCRFRHESICEQNQKRKQMGMGPTIRTGIVLDRTIEEMRQLQKEAK